jgi:hypothetical protein
MFHIRNYSADVYEKIILEFYTESYETNLYRVSQEECAILREGVPYVKIYRCNPKHVYPKLNGYGDNGQRKVRSCVCSAHYT